MMIKGYQTEILSIYDKIRDEESRALRKRKDEISKKYPEIIEIDQQIQKLSLQMALAVIKASNKDETLNSYKERITDLRIKKCEMLVEKGYTPDYLNIHYHCNKCNDTGFIGTQKCECYNKMLIKLYYKDSELENVIKTNNFNNFNINLYPPHKINDEKYSSRRNIENILEYIHGEYLPNFSSISTNLLFHGNPGSGKTYLSYCIAKEILDKGYLVVYKTSDELIHNLREIRFNNDTNLESLLFDCDLLIIDDLGAEHLNEFSITELFNILNKRILNKKKMIISTNLTLPDIIKKYSERISSRLLGDFKLYKFYSEDIRIKLNLQKMRNQM